MPNVRLMPGLGSASPFKIPGTARTYSCAAGAFIDVPDFDAQILRGAGWVSPTRGDGQVGATAARPVRPAQGQQFLDTTVGAILVYDGRGNWLHSVTGAIS